MAGKKPKISQIKKVVKTEPIVLKPQVGPQEDFLTTEADICLYGGSAGSGKTYAELLETCRNLNTPGFRATIFRRTTPMIRSQGALWDESLNIFPLLNGKPNESRLYWRFPSGSEVSFRTLEYEKDKLGYMGSQIALICFDELTHFSAETFFYMLSRNRSICGIKPYVRATCNPDSESWLRDFIDWWIGEDGLPIKERSGVIRYFVRRNDNIIWSDSKNELLKSDVDFVSEYEETKKEYANRKRSLKRKDDIRKGKVTESVLNEHFEVTDELGDLSYREAMRKLKKEYTTRLYHLKRRASDDIKSFTFISASIQDNQILLKNNPGYLGNLKSLPLVERQQLLEGNWNIKSEAGKFFNRSWFEVVSAESIPKKGKECRFFDFAATKASSKNRDPDWTVGIKIRKCDGIYYVVDVVKLRDNPAKVQDLFLKTVQSDKRVADDLGNEYLIRWEEEPGASGKSESYRLQTMLAGYNCRGVSTGGKNKEIRARSMAIQAEIGNIKVAEGDWNDELLNVLHNFTDIGQKHDDEVDGCSGAFNELTSVFIHPTCPEDESEIEVDEKEAEKQRIEAYEALEEEFLMGD